jgi:hypothetical protein
MTAPTFHDVEQLSAYLDGMLSPVEKMRLEIRLQADPALAALLADLRNAHLTLRHTPKHSVPRSFTLNPRMTRIRPPVPRLVPALSWASAVAAFLFIITLGGNLIGQLSFGAAAPMLSAAPMANQGKGLGGEAPAAGTQSPLTDNALNSPTPEAYTLMIPQSTPSTETRNIAPLPSPKTPGNPVNIWLFVLPGLAVLLFGAALLIRWLTLLAFRRRLNKK